MKNIHLIPTPKPSRIYLIKSNNKLGITSNELFYTKNFGSGTQNQHIYITSDEEIKDGDWGLSKLNEVILFGRRYNEKLYKKIILTTDQDLINDGGVQAIDDEFLQWFVNNPSCESVEVDKNWNYPLDKSWEYKLRIIPQEEHPNQIKCYCGHTTTCDCSPLEEPKQETLEEFALKNSKYTNHSNINHSKEEAIILGAKWQQEDILELLKVNGYEDEPIFDLITEQFKKNI
jgi:hypothetical protein